MTRRREFLRQAALGSSVLAGTTAHAAPPPAAPVPAGKGPPESASVSQAGLLLPFIRSQVPKRFALSFLNDRFDSVAAWKKEARGKLLELLHYAPPKCDPRAEVLSRTDRGDYVQERITFNTTPDVRVPAYVLVPKQARRPAPAVVALHDHGGFYLWGKEKLTDNAEEHASLTAFKRQFYDGKAVAAELARQGYVVVVIDMFYWGERRLLLEEDPADWRERPATLTPERVRDFNTRAGASEQLVARTIFAAGFTWPGVMFWDDVRTIDYLLSRPEVDPERIGCVGLSIGGLRACHLAALDDRIKAAVVVGWMASFPAQLGRHIRSSIGFTKLVPGLYQYLDYPDVATLALPSALLVINGSRDTLFDLDGVKASFTKLAACYQKAGVPDKLRTRLYDRPHEFNAEMQAEAWGWLRKWL
jgi:dienelactone hydrolase